MTRCETLAKERVFFAYSTNSNHCSKRSVIDAFIPASFNGIKNCLAGGDVKTNVLRVVNSNCIVISVKSFDIPVSVKSATLGTEIYLLERIYYIQRFY